MLSVSLALSISGAVFVNQSLSGIRHLLPDRSHEDILRALQGLAGDFLSTLTEEQREDTLAIIIKCLSKG